MKYIKGTENSHERVEFVISKGLDYITTCIVNVDLLVNCGITRFACENGSEETLTLKTQKAILELVREERNKIKKTSDCKSYQDWMDCGFRSFEDYFTPGDAVNADVVDYFVNVMPPLLMRGNMVQAAEAFSAERDPSTNMYRQTYTTFILKDEGWIFAGYCFPGESENRYHFDKLAARLEMVNALINNQK